MTRHLQLAAGSGLLFGAMIAVGLNLRGPIVAVAPVLDDIQQDLQITESAANAIDRSVSTPVTSSRLPLTTAAPPRCRPLRSP